MEIQSSFLTEVDADFRHVLLTTVRTLFLGRLVAAMVLRIDRTAVDSDLTQSSRILQGLALGTFLAPFVVTVQVVRGTMEPQSHKDSRQLSRMAQAFITTVFMCQFRKKLVKM